MLLIRSSISRYAYPSQKCWVGAFYIYTGGGRHYNTVTKENVVIETRRFIKLKRREDGEVRTD